MRENSPSENDDEERRTDKRKYVVLIIITCIYTVHGRYESFVSSFTPKYFFVIDQTPIQRCLLCYCYIFVYVHIYTDDILILSRHAM